MGSGRRPVVLFVHGVHTLGGDSMALLRTIEHHDQSALEALAVAPPDSEGYRRLLALAARGRVRLFPLDFGVQDTPGGRRSALLQPALMAGALAGLLRIVAREGVDVVYTLDRSRAVALAAAAAAVLRRRLVIHAHNPWSRWGDLARRRADRVVAVSETVRREYEQNGVPAGRLQTVYNGVDVRLYAAPSDPAPVRAALGVAPDEPLVLLPARLSRYKGQLELVEAMPAILERAPTARFVFAGTDTAELGDLAPLTEGQPSVRAVLERRLAELGLARRAVLLGHTDDMPALYRAADVAVMPSWVSPVWTESCPLVVLEAMSAAKAIVASAVGGTPELIAHDQTGLLVPPQDPAALAQAVGDLLADPERRERLGRAAQARAWERFTIERYCRDLEAVLVGVTGRPVRRLAAPSLTA